VIEGATKRRLAKHAAALVVCLCMDFIQQRLAVRSPRGQAHVCSAACGREIFARTRNKVA
jgi:hypothetical protein